MYLYPSLLAGVAYIVIKEIERLDGEQYVAITSLPPSAPPLY